jgi:hypothetical protein
MTATTTTVRPTRLLALLTWIREHKALIAFCALVGAYYLWTIWTSGSPIAFGKDRVDYYNLLSDGFLSGHLHLRVTPDPALLALPNPYDPVANTGLRIHDLSLYHGRYYLYWGPTPALLLYIPFRLLQLGDLPETLAVFLFAFVGFCFSIACLRALAERFVPGAPRWMLGAAAVALAFGNALPFTLRRASIYEVAITAGLCFSFIALYLLITGLRDGVRLGRLAGASLMVGLAVSSRPPMIIWALGLTVVAVVLWRRMPSRQTRRQTTAALLGPVVGVGILMMLYNALRFGSPTDFGQSYMLSGFDPATKQGNKLGYVPPGTWYYLLARPHLTLGFPFVHLVPSPLSYPFKPPVEYDGVEPVSGLLPSMPFVAFALVAPLVLRGMARRVVLGLIAIALLIMVMVSFALWGATMRYEVDFASTLLIVAALGWFAWATRLRGVRRRLLTAGGVLLIGWGVACGAAFGITGYYDGLRNGSPKTFTRLQNLTSFIPVLLAGDEPKAIDIVTPTYLAGDSDPGHGVGSVTFPLTDQATVLTVVSGRQRRYGLRLAAVSAQQPPGDATVAIDLPDTGQTLRLPAAFPSTTYPISLRRGLNRILFRLTRPTGASTGLEDVHLVPLPTPTP